MQFHLNLKYMLKIDISTTTSIDIFDPNPMKTKQGNSYKKMYKWNTTTFKNIAWDHHSQSINNLTKPSKLFKLIFIHRRLPTGKIQFTYDHRCPHCHLIFDINTPHNHFLQCPQTLIDKKQRLASIELILDRTLSPPKLKKINHK